MRNGQIIGTRFLREIVIVILVKDFRKDTDTEGEDKIWNKASIMSKS